MTCRPTLLVLLGLRLTLLHGTSSALCLEEPSDSKSNLKQVTLPDVIHFVNQTYSTIEATAEEVKQLKKRLDEMDALAKCPENPVETEQTETVFVLFTEKKKNWFEAYADCRIQGMALASIESEAEYRKLYGLITAKDIKLYTKEEDFWLSGTDLGHEGGHVWMSTGHNVTYHKWQSDQPDHAPNCDGSHKKEHCIEIKLSFGNTMNDYCCEKRQNYVCELRK